MNCPACKGVLKKISLATHLLGQTCISCKGVTFTLSDYLHYLAKSESIEEDLALDSDELIMDSDTKTAIVCSCGHIMNKYRATHDSDRRIDCCNACQTVWLDNSEWDYLKTKNLHKRINRIFTDPYQRNIRLQGTVVTLAENYEAQLGKKDYERLKDMRSWIIGNPNQATLLAYLNAKDPYSAEK